MKKEEIINMLLSTIMISHADKIYLKCQGKGKKGIKIQKKLHIDLKNNLDKQDFKLRKIFMKLDKRDLLILLDELDYVDKLYQDAITKDGGKGK